MGGKGVAPFDPLVPLWSPPSPHFETLEKKRKRDKKQGKDLMEERESQISLPLCMLKGPKPLNSTKRRVPPKGTSFEVTTEFQPRLIGIQSWC